MSPNLYFFQSYISRIYCVFSIIQLCLFLFLYKLFIINGRFGRLENYRLHRSHFFVLAKNKSFRFDKLFPLKRLVGVIGVGSTEHHFLSFRMSGYTARVAVGY